MRTRRLTGPLTSPQSQISDLTLLVVLESRLHPGQVPDCHPPQSSLSHSVSFLTPHRFTHSVTLLTPQSALLLTAQGISEIEVSELGILNRDSEFGLLGNF
ncbi:hypothetical protein D8674_002060 [Pyrus ussuriensis x Pyrus communis]|uniref:Uncharacterized protein n=1 Tax=Pyrus ussuriensis x Pyrus communis TaxID=2448454 RepID=A0A5N5FD79_9ROSA|nr:hypothetical protein D8674_002060 [Pyrus ussuriensis x Pyrus communis]